MFTLLEPQSPTASKFALESCLKCLKLLDTEYYSDNRFSASNSNEEINVNIGDCVLFALLQNAILFYEKDLVGDCPNLKRFWDVFKERDSARVDEGAYPVDVKAVARHWIQEEGVMGRVKALGVILGVLPSLIGRVVGLKK
jgi:glutathione S-transferase